MTDAVNPYAATGSTGDTPDLQIGMTARILAGFTIAVGFESLVTRQIQTAYIEFLKYQGRPVGEVMLSFFSAPGYLELMQAAQLLACGIGGYWTLRLSRNAALREALIGGLMFLTMVALSNLLPITTGSFNWAVIAALASPVPGFVLGALLARSSAPSIKPLR